MESSIDWGDSSPTEMGSAKRQEICKTDYETIINKARSDLRECTVLYTAVRSFILNGPRVVNKKHLKSLLGYLIIDIAQRKKTIDDLMEQAEKEA